MELSYQADGASDQYPEAMSVEDTFKLAAGEMNLWVMSCWFGTMHQQNGCSLLRLCLFCWKLKGGSHAWNGGCVINYQLALSTRQHGYIASSDPCIMFQLINFLHIIK